MKTKLLFSILSLIAIPLFVFGYPSITPRYAPGETLEPDCLPSDINCTVTTPAISGANSDITSLSALTAITSGVFGIGTTSPYAKLSVTNTSATQPAFALYGFSSQTSPLMLVASTTGSATSTAFIIDSNGLVGIGTSTPYTQLSVSGGVAGQYFNADSATATSTFAGGLSVAGATGLNVLQNGKVGIGTTSVSSKLTLAGGNFTHTAYGNPTLVGTYNPSGDAYNVYVSGKYAYVADEDSGLQIIDISNPANPTLTGTYDTSGSAYGVYVSGKYAYVGDWFSGLQIIDISNPVSPTLIGTYDTSGGTYRVYVSGKYAYVADNASGLQIIDISNPASPTLTGTYDTSGNATGIYVSGKYAYVADGAVGGLQIIDISNPASPTLTGTYNTSGTAYSVYVSGKYAYVADSGFGLQIIDISNPASPTLTGTYNTSGFAQDVYVSGKYAYVADEVSGLQIIDISSSTNPTLVGTYDTSGAAYGVYVSGKYAYVADSSSGLQIIDINGIETPLLYAGNINTNDITVTENIDVGNNLFVRNGLNVGTGGIFTDGVLSVTGTSSSYIAGNLGLGTTSPYSKLSVTNTSTTQPAFALYGFNSQTSPLMLVASTTGSATSTAFIIDSNGLVGIGTSTPYTQLSVQGGIAGQYFNADSTTATSTFKGGLSVAGSSGLAVLQNGSVGIGSLTPNHNLTVIGNANIGEATSDTTSILRVAKTTFNLSTSVTMISNTAKSIVAGSGSLWANFSDTHFNASSGTQVGNIGAVAGDMYYDNTGTMNNSYNFKGNTTFGSNGTVGIARGIYLKADVSNTFTTAITTWQDYFAGGIGINDASITNAYNFYGQAHTKDTGSITNAYGLYLEQQTAGTNNYQIYVAGGNSYFGGNIGIGTTSPFANLSITGSAGQTTPILALSTSTSGTATSTAFIIDSNGKVGIGTSTPSSELALTQGTNTSSAGIWLAGTDGDYRAIYMSDTSGVLSFNGGDTAGALNTATLNAAGAWTNASDISYKENITDLNTKYTLSDLIKLTPRFYNMKGMNKPQIGFIAQEMKLVVPEVVEGQDGSMGISYGNLVALVVEGIKELSKKVDNLISKIEAEVISFKNVIADTFIAKQKLCINNTCVTESQLQALLQNANLSNTGNSINQIDNASSTNSTVNSISSTTPPIISLLGDNPARIEKGVTFVDPGATAKDSNGLNLMPDLFSNNVDTTQVGEYSVVWEAHDSQMNYATTTRTVIVFDPYASSTQTISPEVDFEKNFNNNVLENDKRSTPN